MIPSRGMTPIDVSSFDIHGAMRGARRGYAVPGILSRAGRMGRFYTDFYAGNKPWLIALAGLKGLSWMPGLLRRALTRSMADIDPRRVTAYDLIGLHHAFARRIVHWRSDPMSVDLHTASAFGRRVATDGLVGARIVYAFNGAALEVFERARTLGVTCVLDQTLAPWSVQRAILREEVLRWPGWEPKLPAAQASDAVMESREGAEWRLAHRILSPSQFVGGALHACGVSPKKVRNVPFGVDPSRFQFAMRPLASGELRILCVGSVCLRKGIPYLLEAAKRLGSHRVKVRLVGPISIPMRYLREYRPWVEWIGAIPRPQVGEEYQRADVLVLPSLCEGSAGVTYEALAAGLPVITTPNAGSVVRDGVDGAIVAIRDSAAIAERLESYLASPALLREASDNARERAQAYTLERYGQRLLAAIGLA